MSFSGTYGTEPGTFQYFTGFFSGILPGGTFVGYYTDGTQVPTAYSGIMMGPNIAPSEPGDAYTGYFIGLGPAYYAGFYSGGPTPTTYTQGFLGPAPAGPTYMGFYTGTVFYAGVYSCPAGPLGFGGNWASGNEPPIQGYLGPTYSAPGGTFSGSRNYAGNYVGFYTAPNINYSGTFSGSRNYAGNYLGSVNYSGPQNYGGSRNYSGNYAGTGNFVGPQNYSGNYLGTGNFAGPASYSGSRTYSGTYAGGGTFSGTYSGSRTYSGNYLGSYSGLAPYSGSRTYSGTYAGGGSFSGTYSGSRNYAGIYNGPANYSGNYSNAFSGNFTGTFSGATIQATKETVSSVKLWIRTA